MLVVEYLQKLRPYGNNKFAYTYWNAVEYDHIDCSPEQKKSLEELAAIFPKAYLIEYFSIHDNFLGKIYLNKQGEWIHEYTVKNVVDLSEIKPYCVK